LESRHNHVGQASGILDALFGHPVVGASAKLRSAPSAKDFTQPPASRFCEQHGTRRLGGCDRALERRYAIVGARRWR